MTHTRACPKCGKVVPWTKGDKSKHGYHMKLICPEHGEFRNRAEEKLRERINK